MQVDRDAALKAGLEALVLVVQERFNGGRSTVAAALKAELQRRFNGRFDERVMGFFSFRDFLKEAEQRRLIKLRQAVGGDLEAIPPGTPERAVTAVALGQAGAEGAVYIRPDIWQAFVDWRPNWIRAYDLQQDRAVMVPATATPFDAPDWIELRKALAGHPDRFRSIEPIPMEKQLAWMNELIEQIQDESIRDVLRSALDSERPFGAFARAAASIPEIKTRWNRALQGRVFAITREWMERNRLLLDLVQERRPRTLTNPSQATSGSSASENEIRARVHAAIDRMPIAELKRIELPIEYLLD
jgi:Uncharacterised protein family (UPF0158)